MRRGLTAILALLAVTTPAACTQEVDSSAKPTLAVSEPGSSTAVTVPFTVKVSTNVRLGTPASGDYHVHVYFDDHVNQYIVMTSDTAEITSAPAGVHVMHMSLRHANHSAVGVETSIQVTIGGRGVTIPKPSSKPSSSSSSVDDPYKFDY